MERQWWQPTEGNAFTTADTTVEQTTLDESPLGELYEQFYVDYALLRRRLEQLLETQGQVTLAQITQAYPIERGLAELLMDRATVERLADQLGTGTAGAPPALPHLTAAESDLYTWLHAHNHRLEQEKIPQPLIAEAVASIG